MTKLRRFTFPFLVGILLLVLMACGGDDDDDVTTTSDQASETTTSQPADDGKTYKFQIVCINRLLDPCVVTAENFVKNVNARSNGRLEIQISAFPELGLAGPDTLRLIKDGTLGMAEIYSGYVGGDLPIIDIGNLWGLAPTAEVHMELTDALWDDMVRIFEEVTGGVVLYRQFYSDNYFFSKFPIHTLDDFKGKKIRQHSTVLDDMLGGLGADGQFVAFAEVYTALERGIIDAGITVVGGGFGQRWYEVADYLVGPISGSTGTTYITVNGDRWAELPDDLKTILREEGARSEAVNLDLLLTKWGTEGEQNNVDAGMELINISPEIQDRLREISLEIIIPNWIQRSGGPDSEAAALFNKIASPILKVKVNPDGSASEIK